MTDLTNVTRTKLVRTLAKPGADILNSLDPLKTHLLHMAVGVVGEVGEIAEIAGFVDHMDHTVEEIADARFYIEGALHTFNLTMDDLHVYEAVHASLVDLPTLDDVHPGQLLLVAHAARFLDCVKKYTVYNKPMDDVLKRTMLAHLWALNDELGALCSYLGVTDMHVHEANLRKLGERYKGLVYTDQAAQERADKVGES